MPSYFDIAVFLLIESAVDRMINGDHRRLLFQVYYSEVTATVEISTIRGRCEVLRPGPVLESAVRSEAKNLFFCSRFCDPNTGTVKQVPKN